MGERGLWKGKTCPALQPEALRSARLFLHTPPIECDAKKVHWTLRALCNNGAVMELSSEREQLPTEGISDWLWHTTRISEIESETDLHPIKIQLTIEDLAVLERKERALRIVLARELKIDSHALAIFGTGWICKRAAPV